MRIITVPHKSRLYSLTAPLGEGQFGKVYKATWRTRGSYTNVAVKMQSCKAKTEEKVTLLQEAAIMAQFMHPNVISIFGLVIESKVKTAIALKHCTYMYA